MTYSNKINDYTRAEIMERLNHAVKTEKISTRKCPTCKKVFKPSRKDKVFCSDHCRGVAWIDGKEKAVVALEAQVAKLELENEELTRQVRELRQILAQK